MEGGAERGLECQSAMDGRESDTNSSNKAVVIPSCCVKAKASDSELEARCHSTVVSGWFSELLSSSGISNIFLFLLLFLFVELLDLLCSILLSIFWSFCWIFFLQIKLRKDCISTTQCGQVSLPLFSLANQYVLPLVYPIHMLNFLSKLSLIYWHNQPFRFLLISIWQKLVLRIKCVLLICWFTSQVYF